MEWINHNHLYYFWVVAREGSVTAAARELRLAQPTISAQLKSLEDALGEELFERTGRRLALSEVGRMVFRHADEMFRISKDLLETLRSEAGSASVLRLNVGAVMVLHKLLVYRLLRPVMDLDRPVRLSCHEGKYSDLLAKLSVFELDVVFADSPIGDQAKVRAFSHLLGESPVAVFGTAALARRYRKGFPASLTGAPLLLPGETAASRHALDHWFEMMDIHPRVVGEFEDSALMKVFGQAGDGLFVMPTVVADEVCHQYHVRIVGEIPAVHERVYAISVERRVKNPAVRAIAESARTELFDEK
ncbi:transcriptional activator NhaR [bacterium]|nr:transcriptional activator NhaR [bacterium]